MKKLNYAFAVLMMCLVVSCLNKAPKEAPAEPEAIEAEGGVVEQTVEAAPVPVAVHKAAFINDPDGYTNVREQPNVKSRIVAKIVDGEQFFFEEEKGSKWVKVYRTADADAACIGYMHGSRVRPVGAALAGTEATGSDVSAAGNGDGGSDPSVEKYLDEYERFANDFADFANNFDKNDPSSLASLARISQRAQELADKGEKLSKNMTPNQMNRLSKLTMKMAQQAKKIQEKQ